MAPQQHPCLACQPASHRHAMTAHGLAMTRCHSKSLATSQAKQAQRANRQRSATTPDGHHQWRSTTTPTGARWGKEEEGHRVEGAPPPMEVQAAAAPHGRRRTTARSTRYLRD
ncbi:hypothetical protein CJ030_MR0G006902 [Morella rubra]|uniref:Uncharacterized protein n=1 Tax=Morella rubra TaxID=262757 RepID=A0A6A1UK13_9ROSI|nr:hypothetical protein CJ030_MR0G006902 [Morella rubra]